MTQPKRIYLAGPEVFFPAGEHQAIVAEKKRLQLSNRWPGVSRRISLKVAPSAWA